MCLVSPRGGAVRAHINFFAYYEGARRAFTLSAGELWARSAAGNLGGTVGGSSSPTAGGER